MNGKWRGIGGTLLVALSVAVSPLQAQRGQGQGWSDARRPGGPNMGNTVDLALQNQEELGLSQDQLVQLRELKAVFDREVAGLMEEMRNLREGIRAGEVDRDDGQRQMQALTGEILTASAPLRGRVQEILTVEQHNKLRPLVRQGRPGAGRAAAGRGSRGPWFGGGGTGMVAPGAGVTPGRAAFGRHPQRRIGRIPQVGLRRGGVGYPPGQGRGMARFFRGGPDGLGAGESQEVRNLP